MPLDSASVMLWPGQPFPLGATYDGDGANFSLFSEVAESVELCLFDDDGVEKRGRPARDHRLHPPRLPARRRSPASATASGSTARGSRPRACGATRPSCCSTPTPRPSRATSRWDDAVFDHDVGDPAGAATRPTARRTCPGRSWSTPSSTGATTGRPHVPWHETDHLRDPRQGPHHAPPGRARGAPGHLRRPGAPGRSSTTCASSGVTAVELMPVHQFVHDRRLVERACATTGATTPSASSRRTTTTPATASAASRCRSSRQMVKTLHAGRHRGHPRRGLQPHRRGQRRRARRSRFKGIDNPAYYRLDPDDPRRYVDYTGTGNSLNMRHPHVLQLIMDSLRYWVNEMHVDGFRFDLAATLARELHDVDRLSSFFDLIQQDPVVSQVKLIAEPWDVGEGGYQVGNFPPAVVGVERQVPRRASATSGGAPDRTVAEFGYRFTGSSDLYEADGRTPVGQHQLRHRPRRLHAGRPGLLRAQAQRGQRRGQPRRHRRQPLVELRGRGPDRRPRRPGPARAPAAQPPGHAAAVPGRAHAARRRRDRPHPGRQQQRLLPGQRDLLVRLGRRSTPSCWPSPAGSATCAAATRSSAAASGSRGGPSWASRPTTSSGSPPTAPP